ncbi:erythromycin esterase family protein [Pontibacter harenae]|uniref:erythromycin esterase family protein n=1 Tax=Pontibacter harenae TaxID=2894083 RepID=UPI001E3B153A|nr:erythromycin esterase family protein [Pontibacter harenae]MCC9169141.1 erythromycin esterase family protein [Pontibacter harenae]
MLSKTLRLKSVRYPILGALLVLLIFSAYALQGQYELRKIAPHIQGSFVAVDIASDSSFRGALSKKPVADVFQGRTVIGFGEANHGTKEFRQAFSLLAKELVSQGRINVIVLAERQFADSWKLNRFVLDPTFEYRPFLYDADYDDLALWLREYNKGKAAEDKVFLMGGDVAYPNEAASNALEYCHRNGIELPPATTQVLQAMTGLAANMVDKYSKINPLDSVLSHVAQLQQSVRDHVNSRQGLSLQDRWYVQSINTLGSAIRFHYAGDANLNNSRDSVMFDNLLWVIQQKPDAKILTFAHNAHIEKEEGLSKTANLPRLGWLLSEHFGKRYMTIATEVEGGEEWAGGMATIKVAQARDKLGNIIGKSVSQNSGLLLLNTAPLREFFNEKHSTSFGGNSRIAHNAKASFYYPVKNYAKAYDAIFWVRSSTPKFPQTGHVYNLVADFSKERDPSFFGKADSLDFLVELNSKTLGDNGSWDDLPSLIIIIFDEKKNLLAFHKKPLTESTFAGKFDLPSNADVVMTFISGKKTESMVLKHFAVNGDLLNREVRFVGYHYSERVRDDASIEVTLDTRLN